MGVSKKDIANVLKMSSIIMATGLTGGLAAGLAPAVGIGAELVGKGRDSEAEHAWKLKMIPEWKEKCRELMDTPMRDDVRKETLMNKIDADWFDHYGERPKRRYVEKIHADVVFSVRSQIAASVDQ